MVSHDIKIRIMNQKTQTKQRVFNLLLTFLVVLSNCHLKVSGAMHPEVEEKPIQLKNEFTNQF